MLEIFGLRTEPIDNFEPVLQVIWYLKRQALLHWNQKSFESTPWRTTNSASGLCAIVKKQIWGWRTFFNSWIGLYLT